MTEREEIKKLRQQVKDLVRARADSTVTIGKLLEEVEDWKRKYRGAVDHMAAETDIVRGRRTGRLPKPHPFSPEASAIVLKCGHPPRSGYCTAVCSSIPADGRDP